MPKASSELLSLLKKNKKIVFTNGCFDILHVGHITYLNQAKKLGDFLVIGLNSDRSVKKLKGNLRPINNQEDRKLLLENLKAVDLVEIFDEDTPVELIKIIKPAIYVKGGDYNMELIPEYPVVKAYGGEVRKLSFVTGYSTTELIQKMK
jgi:rfaE bifunctional protein nucleotidyltransferase chain/domain